jgi:hypothetical protein
VQPAVVIMAHTAPERVRRLISVLAEQPVVLHFDAKAPAAMLEAAVRGRPDHLYVAPRHDCRLASFSMVAAELAALRVALRETEAEHVVVISGTDYPLVDPRRLGERLAARAGRSWVRTDPLPYPGWDSRLFGDGGWWRFRYRFLHRGDQLVTVRGKPLFLPVRRALPAGLAPTASEQWKIVSRRDLTDLLDVLDRRPDLLRYARSMYIPDESFLASVLNSPALMGESRLATGEPGAWVVNWPGRAPGQMHPGWFGVEDLPALAERVAAAPDKLFARKFRPDDDAVLDELERRFW